MEAKELVDVMGGLVLFLLAAVIVYKAAKL